MKTFISFIILSFIALSLSATAGRKLKCADDLKIKACYLPNTDSSGVRTTYVKKCSKGKFCRETYFEDNDDGIRDDGTQLQEIGICVKTIKLGNEGDKCEVDGECKWGICNDGKCTAKKDGESCSSDKVCSGISYCKGIDDDEQQIKVGVCTKLVGNGAACTSDEDCVWGCVCNVNTCVEKYSLADGVAATNGDACQGGEILHELCASDSDKDTTCTQKETEAKMYCTYDLSS